jgi:hypothetical protein
MSADGDAFDFGELRFAPGCLLPAVLAGERLGLADLFTASLSLTSPAFSRPFFCFRFIGLVIFIRPLKRVIKAAIPGFRYASAGAIAVYPFS